MIEGQSSSYDRIKSSTTLEGILAVATSFEESAHGFYTDLAPKVSKNIRWVVEELANEEKGHYAKLTALARRDDIHAELQRVMTVPVTDGKFSDCIQAPDLGDAPDDQAVLQYALGREQVAMEHYRALADSTKAEAARDLFAFLANEEARHKEELEKLYYEVVHSGSA
jgi:rubrerythrin